MSRRKYRRRGRGKRTRKQRGGAQATDISSWLKSVEKLSENNKHGPETRFSEFKKPELTLPGYSPSDAFNLDTYAGMNKQSSNPDLRQKGTYIRDGLSPLFMIKSDQGPTIAEFTDYLKLSSEQESELYNDSDTDNDRFMKYILDVENMLRSRTNNKISSLQETKGDLKIFWLINNLPETPVPISAELS